MATVGPVEFAVGATGVGLIVAGILNVSPLDVIRSAVGGDVTVDPINPDAGRVNGSASGPVGFGSPSGSGAARGAPAGMVTYRNPSTAPAPYGGNEYSMTPETFTGLQRWAAAYGRPLVLTSAYRSYASQARSHAENPDRFASPDGSWHPLGRAVDVHLAAMGADNELNLRRLHQAGEAVGWCFRGRSGPMHASFGGCG